MKEISIFDVIGPNMIGPSSSHTAGALRIALLAGKLSHHPIRKVEFILYGSFSKTYRGHGTDRALVAGILGFGTEDERIRDSFQYAAEQGIEYRFTVSDSTNIPYPNTVEIITTAEDGTVTRMMGVSVGGGNVRLEQINGVEISLSGEYCTLFIHQLDAPGVVAHITKVLNDCGINIAFMRLYRDGKGENAYTIIEADETIPSDVVERVLENPDIRLAKIIEL